MAEKNYDFRARHFTVHQPCRRNTSRTVKPDEILLDSSWSLGGEAGAVTEKALADFMDYLWIGWGISAARTAKPIPHTVWFTVDASLDKGFVLEVSESRVVVRLAADAEAFRAVVYMEDVMGLEGLPVLPKGETVRRPMYRHRSVHSGCGIDEYPDEELLATVHAGYDAIVVFVKDFDCTAAGHCNINDIIRRASRFGIKVLLYNYMSTYYHPDDIGADKIFDAVYGELFRRYPDAAGIYLVGESLQFPSRDPHTTGKRSSESVVDGIPDTRPAPGWYPCEDYPAYLQKIEQAVHSVKPDALVIFSTYNWGYESAELRDSFLKRLPKGIQLKITYDIFSKRTLEGLNTPVMDYTISADQPGEYFVTECESAHRHGIPIEGNVNTAGVAWDFGCVPYVPAPHKLLTRLRRLRQANADWGLDAQYATHHFGWWNCVMSDLGKWASWEDFEPDYEDLLFKIAVRDYGEEAAPHVLSAWRLWSEAMDYYVASNEDQYGPWRVGAAYPFIFQPNITRTMSQKEIKFPTAPHAHFGYKIIKTLYQPYENVNQAPGFLRYPAELRRLSTMLSLWQKGVEEAKAAATTENGKRLAALGAFIQAEVQTVIHIKEWWRANMALQTCETAEQALAVLDSLESLLDAEDANARTAIPCAEADSRLGWEPSMEYVCDRWHLEWKLRQTQSARLEIEAYRHAICL